MMFLKIIQQTPRIFRPVQRHFSASTTISHAKDFTNKDLTQRLQQDGQVAREDGVIQSLKSAIDTVAVFDITQNKRRMTTEESLQALRTLFTLQKSGNSTLHTSQILQHPEFEALCCQVRSKAKFMELNDVIESLKILNYLGVSSKSEIVVILLTYVKNQINDLNLGHITFLEFLLRKYDHSPLVDALRMALPMLLQIQVQYKMDHENLQQLSELLIFISRYNVNEQCTTSVVTALTMHGRKIPVEIACSIIWSLTDVQKFQPMFEKLLQNCYKVLIGSMKTKSVDFRTVERTLTRIVDKYTMRYPNFYSEELLNAVCKFTVDKDVGFTKTIYVLKKLNRISFVNFSLLDYLASEVLKNPAHLLLGQPGIVFTFTGAFSIANYKPPAWSACKEPLLENALFKSDRNNLPWMKFTLDLLCLDVVDHQLLSRVFSAGFLDNFLARENNTLDLLQLLSLYQAVKLLVPNYTGPFPAEQYLQKGYEMQAHKEDYPLIDALEILFGADGVHTGLTSQYWHFIDHAVVFDSETGQVVKKSDWADDSNVVESLVKSPSHKVIALICFPATYYAHNMPNQLKGIFQFRQKTLEVLNIPTVAISLDYWHKLPEHEQLPFLEREIRSRL